MAYCCSFVTDLGLHQSMQFVVFGRHGIRIRKIRRYEPVVPRFVLGSIFLNFADRESAGNRISHVHDEAGLVLQKWVKSRCHLVVGRIIQPGGGSSDKYGHWVSQFDVGIEGRYTFLPVISEDRSRGRFLRRGKSESWCA